MGREKQGNRLIDLYILVVIYLYPTSPNTRQPAPAWIPRIGDLSRGLAVIGIRHEEDV